jgi:pyruvate dehydrogenase E2 component (dihydrolipoamide acetyltransferase)
MTDLTMPQLSESMEEGTILRWLKHDGETVAAGEELVEIETDKATVTYAAEVAGTLLIVVAEGSTVAVGEVIARVGAAEELGAAADVATPPPPVEAAPSAPDGNGAARTAPAQDSAAIATPLARRVARAHGVELDALEGSGPRGRITRNDVLSAAGMAEPAERVGKGAAGEGAGGEDVAPIPKLAAGVADGAVEPAADFEIREPSRVQRLIARRMAEAKATVPDFEVELDVVMDQAIAMRAELKKLQDDESVPSLNDFVVKACAMALRRHPRVNASYADGQFKLHSRVNIGVAVASEEALVVPVVRDADTKSLGAIAGETRWLAARVRAGQVTPPELSGGTFTVSNLGMFGMTAIRPVINLPQAAILGVGAIREILARVDGEVVDRRTMTLTLTADHRILYGADAARFLDEVKTLLESPLKLAL